jgi:amidophosphoribosyltransferase
MRKSATGIDYAVASGMIVVVVVKNDDTYHHLVVVDEYNDDDDTFIIIESVAIDALDSQFKLERSVGAGEAIFISNRGELYTKTLNGFQDPSNVFAPCLFEYVYFARPDSVRVLR